MTPPLLDLRATVSLATVALVTLTGVSFLGDSHWALEILTHFRMQFVALAAALLLLACVLGSRLSVAAVSGALLLNLGPIWADVVPIRSTDPEPADSIKVLMANVLTSNANASGLWKLIHAEQPDVIGLLEVDARWLAELRPLHGLYPYRLAKPRQDNFGIALYSRIPFTTSELSRLAGSDVDAALVRMRIGERDLGLLLAHSFPPVGQREAEIRNAQLRDIERIRLENAEIEFVVVGDLNTTPWSPHFRALTRGAGLRSAARGHGYVPTWPTALAPLMIPIDHGLLSPGLRASSYRRGPAIGSDHRPILMEVGFAEVEAG
jgi:endonuclease/exonuclease/phosphatase (EEP) superfamily protein YafD